MRDNQWNSGTFEYNENTSKTNISKKLLPLTSLSEQLFENSPLLTPGLSITLLLFVYGLIQKCFLHNIHNQNIFEIECYRSVDEVESDNGEEFCEVHDMMSKMNKSIFNKVKRKIFFNKLFLSLL